MTEVEQDIKVCLKAIQFLSKESEVQIGSIVNRNIIKSWFFNSSGVSNYFYGVACVFKTYIGSLWDSLDDGQQIEDLEELDSLIGILMNLNQIQTWEEDYVKQSPYWRIIRKSATSFLNLVNMKLEDEVLQFDIPDLINPDEFGGDNLC